MPRGAGGRAEDHVKAVLAPDAVVIVLVAKRGGGRVELLQGPSQVADSTQKIAPVEPLGRLVSSHESIPAVPFQGLVTPAILEPVANAVEVEGQCQKVIAIDGHAHCPGSLEPGAGSWGRAGDTGIKCSPPRAGWFIALKASRWSWPTFKLSCAIGA